MVFQLPQDIVTGDKSAKKKAPETEFRKPLLIPKQLENHTSANHSQESRQRDYAVFFGGRISFA